MSFLYSNTHIGRPLIVSDNRKTDIKNYLGAAGRIIYSRLTVLSFVNVLLMCQFPFNIKKNYTFYKSADQDGLNSN